MEKAYANSWVDVIQKLAGTWGQDLIQVIVATVTATDIPSNTCTIMPITGDATPDSGFTFTGIQLAAETCDGITPVPTVGSTVIVVYPTKTTGYVAMYSEIDAIMTVTQNGQQVYVGNYYDNGTLTPCEIQLIASTGEQVQIGNPANSNPPVGPNVPRPVTANAGVQINQGTSPAVLGDANVQALKDVYNALEAVFNIASTPAYLPPINTTEPILAAFLTALTGALTPLLIAYNTDIGLTTSTNVTLD